MGYEIVPNGTYHVRGRVKSRPCSVMLRYDGITLHIAVKADGGFVLSPDPDCPVVVDGAEVYIECEPEDFQYLSTSDE